MPCRISIIVCCLSLLGVFESVTGAEYYSPRALAVSVDETTLYVAEGGMERIAVFDIASGKVTSHISVPDEPTGFAPSPDGKHLYVTSMAPAGTLSIINLTSGKVEKKIAAGNGALSPVLSPNGAFLYICNRFDNAVGVLNLKSGKFETKIAIPREPHDAVITPDGKRLLVTNHLPDVPANGDYVAAQVSVVNLKSRKVEKNLLLPNGGTDVRDIAISPDGKYAALTHIIGRYTVPTSQLEQGWINTNAFTLIDVPAQEIVESILLDDKDFGAANPWAVEFSQDGEYLCVTHAGTREVSIIEFPQLLDKLANEDASTPPVSQMLSWLYGIRRRVSLPVEGPRSAVCVGSSVYIAGYFSGNITAVPLASQYAANLPSWPLGPEQAITKVRRGEMFFNDAFICFQQWQSCTSCHPEGRADGLNWDLLNDGIGNRKNVVNLLYSHRTPPSMSTGIRANAEVAVRAGIRYIQFAQRPEEDAEAIDEFLKARKPMPSPHLVDGKISESAQRGKQLFYGKETNCISCHAEPLYTDMQMYDVGSHGQYDWTTNQDGDRVPQKKFDTPTLFEVWRTAPYLHDGRYYSIHDLLTKGRHGLHQEGQKELTGQQIADLVKFVLSL